MKKTQEDRYQPHEFAKQAGVTVRTLHHYDRIGLLKPGEHTGARFRVYREGDFVRLQQIVTLKFIGFSLKEIKRLLDRQGSGLPGVLRAQRVTLEEKRRRLDAAIDAIATVEGISATGSRPSWETFKKIIEAIEMQTNTDWTKQYYNEKQAEHEKYLVERYGEKMKNTIAESHKRIKNWTKADWEKSSGEFVAICQDIVRCMERRVEASSAEVQAVVRRHFQWLCRFWTPNKESYAGHSQLIVDSDLRKVYEVYHPQLAEFLAAGIKLFAERELA